jgi:signal transduction histidine kinase
MDGVSSKPPGVFRIIWRSYVRAALIPMLLVEAVLVIAYLGSNRIIRDANVESMRRQADLEIRSLVRDQAGIIGERINSVMQLGQLFRDATALAAVTAHDPGPVERARYAIADNGVLHTTSDAGTGALFYSAINKIGQQHLQKAWQFAQLDPVMRQIVDASPLVTQAYFNSHDSMNRIYPYFDVVSQYAPEMLIPDFNFYYEADAKHNPERSVVWTDVYLDPAGQGWMASCIAPVYTGDFLEGVIGLDITVEGFIQQTMSLEIPFEGYALLLSRTGNIIAMPAAAERDFGLKQLTVHNYDEAVSSEALIPEAYNVFSRDDLRELAAGMRNTEHGLMQIDLKGSKLAAWRKVPQTGWYLVAMIPEETVYAEIEALSARFQRVGFLIIAGMIVFYLGFFAYLYKRAQRMARLIAEPVEKLALMADAISSGQFEQQSVPSSVSEIQDVGQRLVLMGRALGEINTSLRAAKEIAERASGAKSAFLSHMSHELRTPLNAVLGFTQLLDLEADNLSEEHRDYVRQILQSGRHLLAMINDVLDLARIEAGKLELNLAPCSLHPVIVDSVQMVSAIARDKGIRVTVPTQAEVPFTVLADPVKLRQVMSNLLSNAVKYNRFEGQVYITASTKGSGRLRISIADTGAGIPEDKQRFLFTPFERLDAMVSVEGSGIGLVICRHFVEAMQGEISFESRPGAGSIFHVDLVLSPAPPDPPSE